MDLLHDAFERLPTYQDDEPEAAEPVSRGHPLFGLPRLPHPRRPITPIPADPQLNSTFFKLPPELRQQVYLPLLSGRILHFDLCYTHAVILTPHSDEGLQFEPNCRWRWQASTCHRHPQAQAISDQCVERGMPPTSCKDHDTPCGIGKDVFGLLLCCRLAYREAVEMLYAKNTFHLTTGAPLLFTERLLPAERSSAVTSLIIQVTRKALWTFSAEELGLQPGIPSHMTLLSRIPRAFPGLKTLQLVVDYTTVMGLWPSLQDPQHLPLYLEEESRVRNMLLSPVDLIVTIYQGRLQECVLMMDHNSFDRLMAGESAIADRVESLDGLYSQFWRRVAVPGLGRAVDKGYWVRRVAEEENNWVDYFAT